MKFKLFNGKFRFLILTGVIFVVFSAIFALGSCVGNNDKPNPSDNKEQITEDANAKIFNTKKQNKDVVITGIKEFASTDTLDIPETISGNKIVGIADNAFANDFGGNDTIKTVNIPKSLKIIGNKAFYKCNLLETVNFAAGTDLTEIGSSAFYESGIKNITIPNTVRALGDYAFFDCDNLKTINLPSSLEHFGLGAFAYNNLTQVQLSSDSDFVVENGILFNKSKTEIVMLLGGIGISEYNMPDSVETVHAWAFAGSALSQIKMSDRINIIKWGAFENCKELKEIYLPPSLRNLQSNAFSGCEKLKSVRIESEVVPDLGYGMFDGNAEGRVIYVPGLAKANYLAKEKLKAYKEDITTITSKIYFNTNGGEEIEPIDAEYNNGIMLPKPVRSGCEFLGWYFDDKMTDQFISSRWYEDTDTTLYAKWQILDYSVNYYDAETNNPITDSGNVGFYNVTQNIPLLPAVKEGYTFVGWFDNERCNGALVVSLPTGNIGNKKLYAKFVANLT